MCVDSKDRSWSEIPKGSSYELSVTGAATGVAHFDDDATNQVEEWKAVEFRPGPKVRALSPEGVHHVHIFLQRVGAGDIQVKAKVTGPGGMHQSAYCRTLTDQDEIIRHRLEMR